MLADPLDAAVRRSVVHDRDRHRIRRRRRQRREELGEEVARKVGDDDDPQAGPALLSTVTGEHRLEHLEMASSGGVPGVPRRPSQPRLP